MVGSLDSGKSCHSNPDPNLADIITLMKKTLFSKSMLSTEIDVYDDDTSAECHALVLLAVFFVAHSTQQVL